MFSRLRILFHIPYKKVPIWSFEHEVRKPTENLDYQMPST